MQFLGVKEEAGAIVISKPCMLRSGPSNPLKLVHHLSYYLYL